MKENFEYVYSSEQTSVKRLIFKDPIYEGMAAWLCKATSTGAGKSRLILVNMGNRIYSCIIVY